MFSIDYTYSEISDSKSHPKLLPSVVKTTVVMEQVEPTRLRIVNYRSEVTSPTGQTNRVDYFLSNFHICIDTPECTFWHCDTQCQVEDDKIVNPIFGFNNAISASFLRRAAQSFRDNAHMSDHSDEQPKAKRGRPVKYTTDERKIRHREQALRSYYRRKALKQ